MKQHEYESRSVANEFCKGYARQFGVLASVIDVETENVDAIIDVGGVRIALELVSYCQQDEYHEVERADSHARKAVSEALTEANCSPFTIHISWAIEPRKTRVAGAENRARVPRGQNAVCFAAEIVALVACVKKESTLCKKRISFTPDPDDKNQTPAPGYRFLDSKRFPLLTEFCCELRLAPCAAGFALQTSANFRVVGLDGTQLARVVRDKLGKLARYRDGVGAKQLWLAVHNDGRYLSTAVRPGAHNDALDVIHQVLKGVGRSFDRVWWVENTGLLDAAKLHEVR